MFIRLAAIFCAPVCQDAQHGQVMLLIKWQHSIIEQVSPCDWRLGGLELGVGYLAIGIDIGLLIDPPNIFDGANIKGILVTEIAGLGGFHLTTGLIQQSDIMYRSHCIIPVAKPARHCDKKPENLTPGGPNKGLTAVMSLRSRKYQMVEGSTRRERSDSRRSTISDSVISARSSINPISPNSFIY